MAEETAPREDTPRRSYQGRVQTILSVVHQTPAGLLQQIRETFPGATYVRVDPAFRILVRFDKYVRPSTARRGLPAFQLSPAGLEAFSATPPQGSACWGTVPRVGRPAKSPLAPSSS
jgi:hypothetical protein